MGFVHMKSQDDDYHIAEGVAEGVEKDDHCKVPVRDSWLSQFGRRCQRRSCRFQALRWHILDVLLLDLGILLLDLGNLGHLLGHGILVLDGGCPLLGLERIVPDHIDRSGSDTPLWCDWACQNLSYWLPRHNAEGCKE